MLAGSSEAENKDLRLKEEDTLESQSLDTTRDLVLTIFPFATATDDDCVFKT